MGTLMLSQVFVCSRGEEGHCPGRGWFLSGAGDSVCRVFVRGVSVQGDLCIGSLSRGKGVYVWEGLCHRDPTPYIYNSGSYASYWNAFLLLMNKDTDVCSDKTYLLIRTLA